MFLVPVVSAVKYVETSKLATLSRAVISPAIGHLRYDVTVLVWRLAFLLMYILSSFHVSLLTRALLNVNLLSAVRKYFVFHKQGYTLTTVSADQGFKHCLSKITKFTILEKLEKVREQKHFNIILNVWIG